MQRYRFRLLALCLLAALSLPCSAARLQDEEGASRIGLQNALKALDEAAPQLDAETRAYLPVFRAVLERVFLDRASATESELQLAGAIRDFTGFTGSRGVDLKGDLNLLRSQLKKTPGIRTKPEILASQRKTPGGKPVGVVVLKVGERQKTVAEIVAGAGGYSPVQRAEEIARRLRVTHQQSPLWWMEARAGTIGKDYVVAAAQAPGGYVITADANFARDRGLSREALARRLVSNIRTTYDNLDQGGRDLTNPSPEERREKAVDLRLEGDAAYDRGDTAGAEALYQKAREADPSYVVAYRRLADLYAGANQAQQRRKVLRDALALPNLEASERRELERMLGR